MGEPTIRVNESDVVKYEIRVHFSNGIYRKIQELSQRYNTSGREIIKYAIDKLYYDDTLTRQLRLGQ